MIMIEYFQLFVLMFSSACLIALICGIGIERGVSKLGMLGLIAFALCFTALISILIVGW